MKAEKSQDVPFVSWRTRISDSNPAWIQGLSTRDVDHVSEYQRVRTLEMLRARAEDGQPSYRRERILPSSSILLLWIFQILDGTWPHKYMQIFTHAYHIDLNTNHFKKVPHKHILTYFTSYLAKPNTAKLTQLTIKFRNRIFWIFEKPVLKGFINRQTSVIKKHWTLKYCCIGLYNNVLIIFPPLLEYQLLTKRT